MATLSIKDLSHNEELTVAALSSVRGGSNYNLGNVNYASGGGFGSAGMVIAPVNQTDTKVSIPTIANFGGLQGALV